MLNKNRKNNLAGFYFLHIEPDNCFAGGGVYNLQPEQLKKISPEDRIKECQRRGAIGNEHWYVLEST